MRRALILLAALVVSAPFPALADQQFARIMETGLPLSGGTLTGSVNMIGNDLWCVDDIEPTSTCELADDSAPSASVIRMGQDAWPQAAINTTGGGMCILPGEGTNKVTVAGYTNCATDVVTITINGVATTLTEGTHWTASTSNAATCTSLCTAIDAIVGVSCNACAGAVAPIKRDAGCYTVSISATTDATCYTVVSGADGTMTLPPDVVIGGAGSTTSGIRIQNLGGAGIVRVGNNSTPATWYAGAYRATNTGADTDYTTQTGGGARLSSTGKYCWSDNADGAAGSTDTALVRDAAGIVGVTSAIRLTEMTAPAAGAANTARIFCEDSGGKTRCCVQFSTGAAQCFATEP